MQQTTTAHSPPLPIHSHNFQFANTLVISNDHAAFPWEQFNFPFWRRWALENISVPVVFAIVYLTLVFLARKWMIQKDPFKLRKVLVIWNVGFSVFSAVAFWRTFPDLWLVLKEKDGFYKSVCSRYIYIKQLTIDGIP